MKTLGILGGMGPLATSYFYEMIVSSTYALKDQEHINMVILNDTSIPDRTDYILGTGPNPLPQLISDIRKLESLGVDLITIPCNTCTFFYEELKKCTNIKILNMIRDTCIYLNENNIDKVTVLSTLGTLKSGLYQSMLREYNIEFNKPNNIDDIMFLIYERIKKGIPLSENEISILYKNMDYPIILGCTELSILKGRLNLSDSFIDPLEIERDIVLKLFNKKRRF